MSIIKLKDSGIRIKELHLLLTTCGYSVSQSDVFDINTEKAVRAFQAVEHLAVDV